MITDKQVRRLPQRPGVYILKDQAHRSLYVGKALKLQSRAMSYLRNDLGLGPRTQKMLQKATEIEHIETESELEALLLEAELIKRLKPEYNVRLKDDKAYKYIKVTVNEDFPRVLSSRNQQNDGARYFGPFPEGKTVNNVLITLRKLFPYCNQRLKTGRPCFYYHLGLCPGPCAALISKTRYRENIRGILLLLSGKKKKLLKQLKVKMGKYAQRENFEQAAHLRDEIQKIEYVTQTFRETRDYIENPNLLRDIRRSEIEELIEILKKHYGRLQEFSKKDNFRIEAYDISNTSGGLATGAMVVFVAGQRYLNDYRRFRIRKKGRIDDLNALEEVLRRRFKRGGEDTPDASFSQSPDLILIDGGRGQLNTALKVLDNFNLVIPTVALAKRLEELVIPGGVLLCLPKKSKALQLLKRIRDESHRFAKAYHLKLRKCSVNL